MRPRDSASFHQRRSRSRSRSPSQKRRVLWFSDKKISDSFVLMTPIYYFRGHKRSYDSAFIRIWFQILRPWKLAFSGWLRRKGSRYCQALLLFPSRRNKRLTMSPFIRFYNYITARLRPSVSRSELWPSRLPVAHVLPPPIGYTTLYGQCWPCAFLLIS